MGAIRKRRKVDVTIEKQILIGMVTDIQFLKGFKYLYKPDLFQMPFSRTLARWCWDYFTKYGKAINHELQDIFQEHTEKLDPTIAEAIETILIELSDSSELEKKQNHKRLLDKAEKYMQGRNIESHLFEIQALLENGQIAEAHQQLSAFRQIRKPGSFGLDFFRDKKQVAAIITKNTDDVLFHFKGAAGRLLPPVCREEFVAFAGPEKRGKSFALQEVGKQALLNHLKVAHFNFEMPESKLVRRYYQGLTGMPGDEEEEKILIPVLDCEHNQFGGCKLSARQGINSVPLVKHRGVPLMSFEEAPGTYKPCTYCKDHFDVKIRKYYIPAIWYKKNEHKMFTEKSVPTKIEKLQPYVRGGGLRFVTWPSDAHSTEDVKNLLLQWEEEDNWYADLIITDYADLMVPDKKTENYRHSLDNIWKGHKRLGQEFRAGVVSATQTVTATFLRRIQEDDLSEDKRKASHVDRILALNQTREEAQRGLMRWSLLFERHKQKIHKDVVLLQHLALGNTFIDCYIDDEPYQKEEKRSKKVR